MNNDVSVSVVSALKDGQQHPIPTAWRQTFEQVVDALADGDFELASCGSNISLRFPDTASQMREYIQEYGAKLIALPQASWLSSACIWYGNHWDALIDLWTKEEGRSDLVLKARVTDAASGINVQVDMVYVP